MKTTDGSYTYLISMTVEEVSPHELPMTALNRFEASTREVIAPTSANG